MASLRFYYSDTIHNFLRRTTNEVVGALCLASQHDINDETSQSWVSEICTLQDALADYDGRGSVYLEYNIPRMGRRADAIVLIDDIVFVLEYKTAEQKFSREGMVQVWDYALDLKNFQEGSLNRVMIPILVAPNESDKHCSFQLKHYEDNVYEPLLTNASRLNECITHTLSSIPHTASFDALRDDRWAQTGANDVYVIDTDEHGEVLVPAIRECILDVDIENQKMKIHLMDGLI